MLKKYLYTNLFTFLIVFIATAYNVQAATIPTFQTCLNPLGDVKVEHSSGNHGVPGDTTSYTGRDTVYQYKNSNNFIQCLCPTNGNAIQTNWWNAKDLSSEEIESLKLQGWIYIPTGSAWGLESDPYLAKNMQYSCVGGKGGGDNGGSNNSSSNNSSNNNTSSGQGGGEYSPAEFMALASTGNAITMYLFFIIGISLLVSGIYIRRGHPNTNE